MNHPPTKTRTWLAQFVVLWLLAGGGWEPCAKASDEGQTSQPAGTKPPNGPIDILILAEKDERLFPIAAPLAAKLARRGAPPVLLAVSSPPKQHEVRTIGRVPPERRLILETGVFVGRAGEGPVERGAAVLAAADPTSAALEITARFWGRTRQVVIADGNDATAALLGSTLAAHLGVPFVPFQSDPPGQDLRRPLRSLGVKEVLLASSQGAGPRLPELGPQTVSVLNVNEVQDRVVRAIGKELIRTVILARAPNYFDASQKGLLQHHNDVSCVDPPPSPTDPNSRQPSGDPNDTPRDDGLLNSPPQDQAAWFAPYVSLVRKAPVVLCRSGDGREAEAAVERLVRDMGLRPRTVTILGDHLSIGLIEVKDRDLLGLFEVSVEPCSGAGTGTASAYGVGRLPFSALSEVSYMFAVGLLRQRRAADFRPQVLMVANPRTQYGSLPLAETISRLTSAEFRNRRVPIREFYGTASDDPAVCQAARSASLIIYQGHVTDQRLITPPEEPEPSPEEILLAGAAQSGQVSVVCPGQPMDDATTERPEGTGQDEPGTHTDADSPPGAARPIDPRPTQDGAVSGLWPLGRQGEGREYADGNGWGSPDSELLTPPRVENARRAPVQFDGLPLVILQSCHSLDEHVASRGLQSGACGLIGSVTNIHSASGSAFVKAYCDNVLYRGATAGEALRDARNYFLCLARLKAARGHKEQPKVARAALSFRLWGDPELPVLPLEAVGNAVLPTLSARFLGPNTLSVSVPRYRLAEVKTDRYVARLFPGSQVAGLVKQIKDKPKDNPQRRLMPTYYLRLETADNFRPGEYGRVRREGDADPRAVFLPDPLGRFIHVLYFPAKEKARESIELRFEP